MILVYVTFPTKELAEKLSAQLIEKNLVASSNIFPMESMSAWGGKLGKYPEFVALFKTRKEMFEKVKKFVEENHPYKVPCIIGWDVHYSNKKYNDWINEVTQ